MRTLPWLTLLTFTPALGGVLLLLLPKHRQALSRLIALGASLLTAGLALGVASQFDPSVLGMQLVERHEWIRDLGVHYFLAVDGLSLLMLGLTVVLVPYAILVSWGIQHKPGLFFSLVLFLETGLLGTFTALNFFHWFIFWELGLLPAFFLVKGWGGKQRGFAANQFFLYTLAGSVAMLLAFQAIFLATGTFDFLELSSRAQEGRLTSSLVAWVGWLEMPPKLIVMLVFLGVFLGFAVKVPLVPFHIWLPSAYTEAPTGVAMLLTGAMSKMGVYGFLRILAPLFPEQMQWFRTPLLILAIVTIVYGAWTAMAQTDLKRILAYSSINHLGYCLLGIFAAVTATDQPPAGVMEGSAILAGVLLQMLNHGLTAATLFGLVGWLETRAGGIRHIDRFGGLRSILPVYTGITGIALFSSLGLPGLNGFIGEFLIFKGTFGLAPWAAGAAVAGLLLTAIFILTLILKVFHGPLKEEWRGLTDLSQGERYLLMPVVGLMLLLGIYPQVVLRWINVTVTHLLAQINY
ncbi:MAG TPA: NADH-quinone oxidoreductase subunit M [Candidatus Paceibacterota bacterium]|nr:NADH-quinone oxidoreductase subunit M [Verrucomicrobiota bacterium]HRY48757.1 NADH-quinone oxidoreductase subunit M [Candidatus Paceibacterota bacterium]HRZ99996.1 NADH-quinone oxidoreductase subunit M [Candidatus Paceibacterota bacterium]